MAGIASSAALTRRYVAVSRVPCPQATLVTNWWIGERLRTEYQLPLNRVRWVNDGESFHADSPELAGATPVHGARLSDEENRIFLATTSSAINSVVPWVAR